MWVDILHAKTATNFSGYNMIFTAAWLALRYLDADEHRRAMQSLVADVIYTAGGQTHPPSEQGQALYDLVAAVALSGESHQASGLSNSAVTEAMDKVVAVLKDFPEPPFFGENVVNCDAEEVESTECGYRWHRASSFGHHWLERRFGLRHSCTHEHSTTQQLLLAE